MKNETYDKLKWVAITLLPALATLVGAIGLSVKWEHVELAVFILTAFDTFLGTLLGISSVKYIKVNEEG
ncbi:MAG: phage holin [Streptococcaceae bacterium]|jgi:hypothetical protein|nr:phage holin [Streptococcaceae bacterium]